MNKSRCSLSFSCSRWGIVVLGALFCSFAGYSQVAKPAAVQTAASGLQQRMQQEAAEAKALREARKGYVPGECSQNWLREAKAWAKKRDWFKDTPCVLEFKDSQGYRHLVGVGYRATRTANSTVMARQRARDYAETEAKKHLAMMFADVKEEAKGTSINRSFSTTLIGTMEVYRDTQKTDTGADAFVVVVVNRPATAEARRK